MCGARYVCQSIFTSTIIVSRIFLNPMNCFELNFPPKKRHYKVRDGPSPGTFYFSVLDNGITSNEFWTIVDVADDLSWIVFHYAGAASAVGQVRKTEVC